MSISDRDALQRVIEHREIFHDEMLHLMRRIMSGQMSPVVMAALITGLRVKKETVGELTAAASVMRELAHRVNLDDVDGLVDIVGTGGDGAHSFNISTTSMFVAAAAGARVAKHGGRSVSSTSGAADVLETLGAQIQLQPDQVAQCLQQSGIGFMFAPAHHSAMRHAAAVRKELGVRTLFNILGPLTNPAGAPNQLLGVFHPDLVGILVRVLQRLGSRHALVVHGVDGLDEISLCDQTLVGELRDGAVVEYRVAPEDFGLRRCDRDALRVDGPVESAQRLRDVLDGASGPSRDIVLLNAGGALYAGGVADSLADGVRRAAAAIDSGAAAAKLQQFIALTCALAADGDRHG